MMTTLAASRRNLLRILLEPFEFIARHRTILYTTTLVEIRNTYAGSVLGAIWLMLGPLLMLAVYAVTYAVIFRVRPADMTITEYVLYVFSGIVPFLAFSSGLSAGALSLVSNRGLLLNTIFPVELIPLRTVLVGAIALPTGLVVLLFGDLIFGRLSWTWLLMPVVMVLELMFLAGVCWILSLVALLFRDLGLLISYIVTMLMVIAPIAYTPSMMPPQLAVLIYINPASYFVMSTQSLIILDQLPPWKISIGMVTISVGLFIAGYHIYRRAKGAFYDFA
jgi:homopolymeric O-antigen transport system permease protein